MTHIESRSRIIRGNENEPALHQWLAIIAGQSRFLQTVCHHSRHVATCKQRAVHRRPINSIRSTGNDGAVRLRTNAPHIFGEANEFIIHMP